MIDFYITEQSIRFASPVIAANSLNYLEAQFHFSGEGWKDCSKWAHFRQGETVYDIALEEDRIGAEKGLDLSLGEWEVYVTGNSETSRLTTVPVILTVMESGLIDEPLHKIPQSVAEQVDSKANLALQKMKALEEDAENGRFDGKSFRILGYYETLDELIENVTDFEVGDTYCVGEEAPYDMYIYDGVNECWTSNGPVIGVKGDTGANGRDGVTFTPQVSENGNLSWINDGGRENPGTINIMGPKGDRGANGTNGKSPFEVAVEQGFQGTQETFNWSLKNIASHASAHQAGGADAISVSSGMIAASAVTTEKINNSAVTAAKIAANAVSNYYTATTGASWSGSAAPYSIAVTVSGLTTSDHPIVWLNPSTTYSTAATQANAWKYIYRAAVTAANTLTLYSSVKSNVALPIQMVAVRK